MKPSTRSVKMVGLLCYCWRYPSSSGLHIVDKLVWIRLSGGSDPSTREMSFSWSPPSHVCRADIDTKYGNLQTPSHQCPGMGDNRILWEWVLIFQWMWRETISTSNRNMAVSIHQGCRILDVAKGEELPLSIMLLAFCFFNCNYMFWFWSILMWFFGIVLFLYLF